MGLSTAIHHGLVSEASEPEFGAESHNGFANSGRKIVENQAYVIIPSLGPINKNHLLICSKRYTKGLHDFDNNELLSLQEIFKNLAAAYKRRYGPNFIVFENGTTQAGVSGCSITHFHMHFVPTSREIKVSEIDCEFIDVKDLFEAASQARKIGDYLFVSTSGRDMKIGSRSHLYSQYMRRLVATVNERDSWDWRTNSAVKSWKSEIIAAHQLLDGIRV